MVEVVKDCVVREPEVLTVVPTPNWPPDKVQVVLLLADQLRVEVAPLVTVVGEADKETLVLVGAILLEVSVEPLHETRQKITRNIENMYSRGTIESTALMYDMMASLQ